MYNYKDENKDRKRCYGVRIGDTVRYRIPGDPVDDIDYEVTAYDDMDNNRVYLKGPDGETLEAVAEYCLVVTKVEDKNKERHDMRHIDNCTVLRPAGYPDCTGNGITARNDSVTVILDVPYLTIEDYGKTYYDRPDEKAILDYVKRQSLDPSRVVILCDKLNNTVYTPHLKPLDSVYGTRGGEKLTGPCSGGNYVAFREEGAERVIRVHDRYDTQKDWDGLSS